MSQDFWAEAYVKLSIMITKDTKYYRFILFIVNWRHRIWRYNHFYSGILKLLQIKQKIVRADY